jgi:hypothetical protein
VGWLDFHCWIFLRIVAEKNYNVLVSAIHMERSQLYRKHLLGTADDISYKRTIYSAFIRGRCIISETCRSTIDADMPRTWPKEHIPGRDIVKELLIEYAATQQGDSYLQGFNYIMTVLWSVFHNRENARADTFWSFARMVGLVRPLMPDFNSKWFHWYRNHWMDEFKRKIARRRPMVAAILSTDLETFSALVTVKWFMIWFTQSVAWPEILILWDFLIQVPPRQLMNVYTLITVEIITEAATTLTYACSGDATRMVHQLLDLKISGISKIVEKLRKKF